MEAMRPAKLRLGAAMLARAGRGVGRVGVGGGVEQVSWQVAGGWGCRDGAGKRAKGRRGAVSAEGAPAGRGGGRARNGTVIVMITLSIAGKQASVQGLSILSIQLQLQIW